MSDDRKQVLELIEAYRALPALWDVSCSEYSNRSIKSTQYDMLLEVYRKHQPDAKKADLKKKINVLRTNYRRESKRKKELEAIGSVLNGGSFQTLYYFDALNFLSDVKKPNSPIPPATECEPISKKKKKNSSSIDELVRLTTQRLKALPNSYQQTAIVWGEKLSKMNVNQRIIAEKVINEVMFSGELNLLTFNTTLAHINSVCNLDPSSYAFEKNVDMGGSESLVESSNTNPYAVRFNQIANDAIHDHINYPSSSGESVNDEVITDRESEHNEQNFVISEYDPLDNTIKVEE